MALIAFDGTWNEAKESEDPRYKNTNVFRFYEAYHHNSGTDDLYVPGVGTRHDLVGRVVGGVFGLGVLPRILEAYDHLCHQWIDRNDRIIDIVGFSRGAATTLDFCHHLLKRGIRRPSTDEVVEPSPTIRFLGLWDIVAAFGVANLGNTELNIGHHLTLPASSLTYCFHALALDEQRPSFLPTRLPGACEVWFRGVHSDVGGGNGNRGLNDVSMRWMFSKAKAAGLPMTDADIAALQPNPATEPSDDHRKPIDTRLVSAVDRRHHTVSPMRGWITPPDTCPVETEDDERRAVPIGPKGIEIFPTIVRVRLATLWETADAIAKANDFTLDQIRDPLLTLFQGRIGLVTNDAQLTIAREAVARLMNTTIKNARDRGFHVLSEFFLNEALFQLPRLFPLTD